MVETVGESKVGQIECIVCGEFYWYPGTPHHETHSVGLPQDYYQYKEYVGEQFGLSENHELLTDDTVINPNKWFDVRDDYPEVEIGLKIR
ncbi:hypothetical protein OB955_14560 [Halobacteria archaeon AArc-m2/3/4]|uniref:GyrI-like small molecule binding domain-containing protein n=1 Tax=Natronoglomus mannanivorans TaxID=2979990 RepID=A0ABT2QG95_9EURY|nr:hypothetical protein [Halobacteria archaeon AArc-m2/3/4]